jgi:biotin carboxyl carrier protein
MKQALIYNGQEYAVEIDPLPDGRFRASIGGRVYVLNCYREASGTWSLAFDDGRRATAHVAASSEGWIAQLNGQIYRVRPSLPVKQRGATRSGSGSLDAQMPGQVTAVLVQDGDRISRGQTLVILEAMKMELRVNAPADGIAARVLVSPGQVVERGQQLVELRADA